MLCCRLLVLWLLFCVGVFGQEVQYNSGTARPRDARSGVLSRRPHYSDYITVGQVERASTGTRPCCFVDDVVKPMGIGQSTHKSTNETFRCDRDYGLQREASEGNRHSLGLILGFKTDRCDVHSRYAFAREGIFYWLTDSQVNTRICGTNSKIEILELNSCFELMPSVVWNVDRGSARMLSDHLIPVAQNVSIRNKTATFINEKSSSGDLNDLEIFLLVYIPADDRNDRPLNIVYCFDGNVFLPEDWVRQNEQKCANEKIPHSDSDTVSDEDLRRRFCYLLLPPIFLERSQNLRPERRISERDIYVDFLPFRTRLTVRSRTIFALSGEDGSAGY